MTPYDPFSPRRRNIFQHAGFRMGAVGGVIMIAVHLFLLAINRGTNNGDVLAGLLQLVVYFFIAHNAAEQHHATQLDSVDHLRGVQGAGVGAAVTTSILVWIYIVVRGIFRDAFGITVIVEPVSLCFTIFIDVLLALGIGSLGGGLVAKKYRGNTNF
ncbi:MAG: hypothetical protein FJ030_14980 [Chloroflexi bacterium]|nr:hypothetical protein [Chloroflexota bacterium]